MLVIICGKHGNNRSRTEHVTERTQFSKSRSNDLEDIDQAQRSPYATHLLMLVIICNKYGKIPSRTVDATEWTRFSRPRPGALDDIGQAQGSLYVTHHLILVIIFKVKAEKFQKFAKNSNVHVLKKPYNATHPLMIVIICVKYKKIHTEL